MTLKVDITHRLGDFGLEVAFEAGAGVTALFGRSGSGKTSIINAVAGLIRPDTGRITLNGRVLMDAGHGTFVPPARRRLGYVFQDMRLFPHMDVRANLLFGARFVRDRPAAARIEDIAALLGLEAQLKRHPADLSGGEKSRVALGRAVLSSPEMLLMDEPLAALDQPRKSEILPYLERLNVERGIPILYVSHDMSEIARLADRIVMIQEGRVVRVGALQEVLSDPEAVPLIGPRDAGAMIEAKVIAHEADGLTRLRFSAGELLLAGVKSEVGTWLRLRVPARDIVLCRARPEGLSALNIFPARIEMIRSGDGPGAAVAIRAGRDRLLARVPARALVSEGFEIGQEIFAVFQPTAIARNDIGWS